MEHRSAGKTAAHTSPFGGWRHRASQFYFLIILFSFPLFSIPCQKGTCSSPIEVVAANLLSNGANEGVSKVLLYPGLVFSKIEGIVADNEPFTLPDWDTLLKDTSTGVKGNIEKERSAADLGSVVGSYLCVIGAVLAIFGLMQVSACGMITLLWYIYTIGGKDTNVFALPMFGLAMFCAIGGLLNLEGILKRERGVGSKASGTTSGQQKKQS